MSIWKTLHPISCSLLWIVHTNISESLGNHINSFLFSLYLFWLLMCMCVNNRGWYKSSECVCMYACMCACRESIERGKDREKKRNMERQRQTDRNTHTHTPYKIVLRNIMCEPAHLLRDFACWNTWLTTWWLRCFWSSAWILYCSAAEIKGMNWIKRLGGGVSR